MEMDQKNKQNEMKTKEELYMERLQKWKEQKVLKEKTNNNKKTTSVKVFCRKPVAKNENRSMKNRQDSIGKRPQENTEKQKINSATKFTQVNKKPTLKCRNVKSRLMDIPARLSAPPKRSTITSSGVEGKTSTARSLVRQSMPSARQKPVKPSPLCHSHKTNVRNSQSKSIRRPGRSSLAITRGSSVKDTSRDKHPHSILKRKSCVSYLSSQSDDCGKECPGQNGLTHVKFQSLDCSESHEKVNPKYRKTPRRSQESLRNQLNTWLATKETTPSRFRHLMCFDAEMSAKKQQDSQTKQSLTVEELSQQQDTLAKEDHVSVSVESTVTCGADSDVLSDSVDDPLGPMLTQCQTLLELGCPTESILGWLQEIRDNVPSAASSTSYYLLKVAVLKPMGDLDPVLATFEEAITNSSQPADELARAMSRTVREMTAALLKGPTREQATADGDGKSVADDNVFQSTAVKYYIQDVSSFKKRRSTLCAGDTPRAPRAVITPVRRSTRRSTPARPRCTPAHSLDQGVSTENTKLYDSLADVPEAEKTSLLFRPNDVMKTLLFE